MIWATVAVVLGIALTVISADKFVEGAAEIGEGECNGNLASLWPAIK